MTKRVLVNRNLLICLSLTLCGTLPAQLADSVPTGASAASKSQSPSTESPNSREGETLELAPFQVSAGPDKGYKVSSATTATRTNTPLIDIPQTVDIVTSKFWNDRNASTYEESFKYVSNIYVRNRNAGGGGTVSLRGFQTSNSAMLDGIRLSQSFKHDLIAYERLEIVKGPASAVQGRAGGSGMLNFIYKKPELEKSWTQVKYTFGADEFDGLFNRLELNANLKIGSEGKFAARIAATVQESDDYIEFQQTKKLGLYPSFRWKIGKRTELVLNTDFLKASTPSREEGHGFQVYPYRLRTLMPMFNTATDPITALRLPDNFNPIGPDNYQDTRVLAATMGLTHQFSDNLSYRQAAHWRDITDDNYTYDAASNTATRIASGRTLDVNNEKNITVQGDLIMKYATKYFSGHTLVGYNYSDMTKFNERYRGAANAPFNFIDLKVLAATPDRLSYFNGRTVGTLPRTQGSSIDSMNFSYYANQSFDLLKERLIVSGGLRRELDDSAGTNLLNGAATGVSKTWLNSWQYGVTYKIQPRLAIYGVMSRQNDPSNTRAVYGGLPAGDPRNNEFMTLFPATNMEELGVKADLFGGRVTAGGAYWKMTKEGGVQAITSITDSTATNYSKNIQVKGALSEGFELNLYGDLSSRFSFIANYTRMTTSAQDPNNINARITGLFAPSWGANVWGIYTVSESKTQSFTLKGGVSYIGPLWTTLTGFPLQYEIPHVQKNIDVGLGYRWHRWEFDFMVNNLGNDPFWITRDQPYRNYRFSVSTKF